MSRPPAGLSRAVQTIAAALAPADRPDGELCAAWHARRDEAAFAELVRRYGRLVWGVCRRAGPDPDDSYQAVFLLLARRAGRLTGRTSVAPWLYLTAVRVARRAARTATRRRAKEQQAAKPEAVFAADAADWRPACDTALAGLPAKYRDAVVLCELGGLSRAEAAARLAVADGTLASRLAAARVLLRNRLVRRGVTAGVLTVTGVPPAVTAGVAAAAAQQLARGVTTMLVLKKLTAGLAVAGLLAGAGVGLAVRPDPAPAAAPPPGEPDWKAEFRKAYGLADGQVVRRVPPPYPAGRTRFLTDRYGPKGTSNGSIPLDRHHLSLRWRGDWPTDAGSIRLPVDPAVGLPLGTFLELTAGVPAFEQRVAPALRDRHVTGEFVVRGGAGLAEVVAALGPILRDECGLAVVLSVEPVEQEVYVVAGKYDPRPLGGRKPGQIDVFDDYRPARGVADGAGGGSGTLAEFVAHLGGHIDRSLRYEVTGPVPKTVEWRYQARSLTRFDPANGVDNRADDRDPDVVLPNVGVQTGLTFTKQKRVVPVLVAKPAG